jgi:hypothetical protein
MGGGRLVNRKRNCALGGNRTPLTMQNVRRNNHQKDPNESQKWPTERHTFDYFALTSGKLVI